MPKTDYSSWEKEDLIKRINALERRKKYGLVWDAAKEPEKVVLDCQEELPVLKEISKNKIHSVKDDVTHILIEGDNYHALSVLNYTHEKAVDLIYIDPPYNTGNDDFIYNDRYVDREDAYRHSKWLSSMEKRLKLAKNLLKDTGVIFISIDETELGQLKLLLDNYIFNEKNNHAILTWAKRTKPTNIGKARFKIQQNAEYILVYSLCTSENHPGFKILEKSKKNYPDKGKFGSCRFEDLERRNIGAMTRNTMLYELLGQRPRKGYRWQISEKAAKRLLELDHIELVNGKPKIAVYPEDEDGITYSPFWSHLIETDTAETGKAELSSILGHEHGFDTVKPVNLVRRIIEHFDNNVVVLDFFAGTGTTAHAILKMNSEDSGKRQFILCTNNEANICSDLCYPRIQKVMEGYKNSKGQDIEGLGGNLKYYRTSFVPAAPTDKNKELLTKQSIEMLTLKEGTFEKVTENPSYVIYRDSDKYTGIIFDQLSFAEFKKSVAKVNKPISLYVFSLADEDFGDDFADMKGLIKICAIPEAILRVYRRIFR